MPTPEPPSLFWQSVVDPPVKQDGAYSFDKRDRAYIDSQIRACQTLILSGVIRLLTNNFTQPPVGSNVTVSITNTSWMVPGLGVMIPGGGIYSVVSIVSPTQVTLQNVGSNGAAAPGATVVAGVQVVTAGLPGAAGAAPILRRDVISDSTGLSTVQGFQGVPVAPTTPYVGDVMALEPGTAGYAPSPIEQIFLVDKYIAIASGNSPNPTNAQQSTGIQNAFNDFAAATLNGASFAGSSGPTLVFGPKRYFTTATIKCVGACGGRIRGAGWQQSYLTTSVVGTNVVIDFVNCRHLTIEGLGIRNSSPFVTLTAGATAGATTIHVSSGTFVANGAQIALQTATAAITLAEVVTVTAGGGTTTLTVSPLRNSYSLGDTVFWNAAIAFRSYQDVTQPHVGGPATHLSWDDCGVEGFAYPWSFECNGGTGSSSDYNNESHTLNRCVSNNAIVAGVRIGHLNSLANRFINCDFAGSTCDGEMLTGGSFSKLYGQSNTSGYAFQLGGVVGRSINIIGTTITDGNGPVLQARASDNLFGGAIINFTDYSHTQGTSGSNNLLFDVTGTLLQVNFDNCFLAGGAGTAAYLIYFKDPSGSPPKSVVNFRSCVLGAYGGTADGVVVNSELTQWTAATDGQIHETELNSGKFIGRSAGLYANSLFSGLARLGQLYGWSVFQNTYTTSASPYTADSNVILDRTIRVDNSGGAKTQVLPAPSRKGREIVYEALVGGTAITIQPPTTTPASTINGLSTFVWTPKEAHSRITVSLADTLTSGVLCTWTTDIGGGGSGGALQGLGICSLTTLTNSVNNNAGPVTNETVIITNPTSGTPSLTGLSPSTGSFAPGQRIEVICETPGVTWTIVHNSGSSAMPFLLPNAANMSLTVGGTAGDYQSLRFRFDGTYLRLV